MVILLISKLLSFRKQHLHDRSHQLLGNKKRGLVSYSEMENETNPLRFLQYSDDFSDGVNDTEQKPDEQGESSDETTHDDIQDEDADCA